MFYAKHRSRRKKMKFVKGIAMLLCLVTIFTSVWFTGNIVMAEDGVSNAELYELLIKAESKSEFEHTSFGKVKRKQQKSSIHAGLRRDGSRSDSSLSDGQRAEITIA